MFKLILGMCKVLLEYWNLTWNLAGGGVDYTLDGDGISVLFSLVGDLDNLLLLLDSVNESSMNWKLPLENDLVCTLLMIVFRQGNNRVSHSLLNKALQRLNYAIQ